MKMVPADSRFALATDAAACAHLLAPHLAAQLPPADWSALRVTKALPRKDGGFGVQYTLPLLTGGLLHLGGHLVADDGQAPAWAGATAGTAWLADPGLALAHPGADPRLRAMRRLGETGRLDKLADRLGWSGRPDQPARVLAYRLEKRCVLRLGQGPAGSAIIKVMRPKNLPAMVEAHRQAAVAVPKLIHVDSKAGIVVMDDLPGAPLDQVAPAAAPAAHAAAGQLLRDFHLPAPQPQGRRTVASELDQLAVWTRLAARLFPQLDGALAAGLAELEATAAEDCSVCTRLHRDFYDKQILVDGARLTLLDLDTAATGDPALDLGNYLAHLRLRHLQDPLQHPDPEGCTQAFLGAYRPHAQLLGRVAWWQAAALLRLAALYSFRPRWWNIANLILEEVGPCLRAPEYPL